MNTPIRTLIVDDEAPARGRLRRLLASESDIDIVGEAATGEDAIRLIGELRPALLFLDVQMPAPDGLGVLRAVRDEWLPCTIFTTAYAEHAVAAFELNALDYLLKPFAAERFATALERARARIGAAAASEASGRDERVAALVDDLVVASRPVERFLVKHNERYLVVRAADIQWAEAAANYVILHTPAGKPILRKALSALETELDPRLFFRVNRSAIVNLSLVREVAVAAAGEHTVTLQGGHQLTLTRGLRELQDRLRSAP
jgi:two-component system LytT family response regulator